MQRHQLMVSDIDCAPRPGQREICFPAGALNHLQRAAATEECLHVASDSREVQP